VYILMGKQSMSMLPSVMDGKNSNGQYGKDNMLQEWQRNAPQTISRSMERPGDQYTTARGRTLQSTIRTVTPDSAAEEGDTADADPPMGWEKHGRSSSHTSPRSIPGGGETRERRQGLIFEDSFPAGETSPTQKPLPTQFHSGDFSPPPQASPRPRTRTLDEPRHRRQQNTIVSKSRHRIGSVHSTNSAALVDETRPTPTLDISPSQDLLATATTRSPRLQKSGSFKERSGSTRRLVKKSSQSSPRPSSPVVSPTVDSLPVPVETSDANKILRLMRSLSGRMRGAVEYQASKYGPRLSGVCYIDDLNGVLIFEDDDRGPFHQILVPDLRGCRVRPTISPEKQDKCLEISTLSGSKLQIFPLVSTEFDHWLAALLCWQQIGPGTSQTNLFMPDPAESRVASVSRGGSPHTSKDANIIKVGKLLLWDRGALLSPTSILRRLAGKDARSARRSWRRVSCILQDNGEFKLLTENDVTLLSVIQLSQLSRCAIQQLDRSVLNEEYCIAIFPQYTSISTSISIIRPVYIALESRVLFEVWFVLLRAFAIPELYGSPQPDAEAEHSDLLERPEGSMNSNNMFRIEKSLSVRVIEAKIRKVVATNDSLIPSKNQAKADLDTAMGDYFAEVILDGEIRSKTMTKIDTKTPFWREDCDFTDLPAALPNLSVILKRVSAPSELPPLTIRSSTSIHSADQVVETVCGAVELRLDQVEQGKDNESWWPILDSNQESIGEMFLKIRHDETAILMAKEYQPISELLHRFSSGLTIQIAQVVPSKLRPLSEILMNIFQVSGQSTAWLMALVEDEIDGVGKETPVKRFRFSRRVGSNDSFDSVSERELSVRDMGKSLTGEANLLFRGNSLLTQALDFHMRRVGKEYLEEVLYDRICEINTLNPDCEVDPSRLAHGDDLTKNWAQLTTLTTGFWGSIASSAKRCPAELRHILKFIRAVAEDRYGDFLRTVPYTSVSGFLFLRFFCPAILNPKLFGLLRDHPQPKAQRTLTLIAKSLQVLANLSTFGQKESWMEPMNRFLASHKQGVKDFIDDVCSISAERNNFALPASYSTPITILGRLPATSREGFPSLPYLIDRARNFAMLIKLWLDSTHYLAPHSLEGDLIEFHELCVALQERTNDCLLKAEQADKSGAEPFFQWDDVAYGLAHTALQPLPLSKSQAMSISDTEIAVTSQSQFPPFVPTSSTSTLDGQNTTTAPGSSHSAASSKERYERQNFWEQTSGKDSKYVRPYDPENMSQASPPSRGASRNGKPSKSLLTGLRKRGSEKDREKNRSASGTKEWDKGVVQRPESS
jgi:hypothetical protein